MKFEVVDSLDTNAPQEESLLNSNDISFDDLDKEVLDSIEDDLRRNRVDNEMKEQILDVLEQPLISTFAP